MSKIKLNLINLDIKTISGPIVDSENKHPKLNIQNTYDENKPFIRANNTKNKFEDFITNHQEPFKPNEITDANIEKEVWIKSLQFPTYALSSYGRICNISLNKILTPKLVSGNIYYHTITINKKSYSFFMDEIILKSFFPYPIDGKKYYPKHKNGNRSQNTLDNVEWSLEKEKTVNKYKLENLPNEIWKQMYD